MEQKKKSVRNGHIELWRFIASIAIAGYHGRHVFESSVWVFVEFFFMITGFYAFKLVYEKRDSIKNPEHFPVIYTFKKLLKFLPYIAIPMVVFFVRNVIKYKIVGKDMIKYALYCLENMFMLNGTGAVSRNYKVSDGFTTERIFISEYWYFVAMIAALPIMLYLVYLLYNRLGLWLVGILPLYLYGNILINDGTIEGWHDKMHPFLTLDSRALAGMLLGGLIYYLADTLKKVNWNKFRMIMGGIVEVTLMMAVTYISTKSNMRLELLVLALPVISLSLTMSEMTWTAKLSGRGLALLGKLSLPIYCVHPVLLRCYIELVDSKWYIYYGLVLACAGLLLVIVESSSYFIKKIRK